VVAKDIAPLVDRPSLAVTHEWSRCACQHRTDHGINVSRDPPKKRHRKIPGRCFAIPGIPQCNFFQQKYNFYKGILSGSTVSVLTIPSTDFAMH
jgi:hypothetical protein